MRLTRFRPALRWGVGLLALAVGFFVLRWGTGNLGTVGAGRIFRSGQLGAGGLSRTVRDHRIKTVLNLRGDNPDQAWYRDERRAALDAGATLVDVHMASDQWLTRREMRTLVEILDGSEYPLLIHCESGAERTGLVAAIATLLQPGHSTAPAWSQFSIYYLYLPLRDGLVMRGHLASYEAWLKAQNAAHPPERFRQWLDRDYRPGSPSREEWPYNPYPTKVVSRPDRSKIRR